MAWQEYPASTNRVTRRRRSSEYGLVIAHLFPGRGLRQVNHEATTLRSPDDLVRTAIALASELGTFVTNALAHFVTNFMCFLSA
jgi:hypothetical protein